MAASVVLEDIHSDLAWHSTRCTSVPSSANRESHPVSSSRALVSVQGTATGVGLACHSLNCSILGTSSGTLHRVKLLSCHAEESSAGDKSATIPCTGTHSVTLYMGSYVRRYSSKSNPSQPHKLAVRFCNLELECRQAVTQVNDSPEDVPQVLTSVGACPPQTVEVGTQAHPMLSWTAHASPIHPGR